MSETPPTIVTDSSISLPESLIRGLPLFIAPFEVHHEGQVYRDGQDLSTQDFYRLLRRSNTLPTTSAPPPGAFLEAFHRASKQSSDIICLTLSSDLSAAHAAALIAKREAEKELPRVGIHVVDSRTAGPAEGLLALEAARSASAGAPVGDVLELLNRRRDSVFLIAYMETLYYVWRGGRVPRAALWLSRLLRVKPLLQFTAGQINMLERPRTSRKAMDRLLALMLQRLHGSSKARIAIMHADALEHAQDLAERVQQRIDPTEIFITEFTPVVGTHTGPGLVGLAFQPLDEQVVETADG
jgi:DegV family protein with EDD domain